MQTKFKKIEECRLELISATKDMGFSGRDIDFMPAHAARVSFGNEVEDRPEKQDAKLMRYLADHQHMTPFEYQHATFMIECPLFIRSQIHRHRTFSFNEISRRYTSEDIEFWVPTTWRKQAESNRQASSGDVSHQVAESTTEAYRTMCDTQAQFYAEMLRVGVAREQARAVLPQSLLTRFYMGGNLRNWVHFLKLRMDSHAQPEVQCIASRIYQQLADLWPNSMRALMS